MTVDTIKPGDPCGDTKERSERRYRYAVVRLPDGNIAAWDIGYEADFRDGDTLTVEMQNGRDALVINGYVMPSEVKVRGDEPVVTEVGTFHMQREHPGCAILPLRGDKRKRGWGWHRNPDNPPWWWPSRGRPMIDEQCAACMGITHTHTCRAKAPNMSPADRKWINIAARAGAFCGRWSVRLVLIVIMLWFAKALLAPLAIPHG